jgi:hypothetical protein
MLTVTLGEQSDTLKPNHKRKIKHITPGQLARALTSPGAHAPLPDSAVSSHKTDRRARRRKEEGERAADERPAAHGLL